MKKLLLFCAVLYLLVEGENVIGDGLWLWHRGHKAVEDLAESVDNYYPKVLAVDSIVDDAIVTEFVEDSTVELSPPRKRRIIKR